MSRLRSLILAALMVAALVSGAIFASRLLTNQVASQEPLGETAGRVQLVIDEQDVGLVPQGMPLEVEFTVANTGSEKLFFARRRPKVAPANAPRPCSPSSPARRPRSRLACRPTSFWAAAASTSAFSPAMPPRPSCWLTIRGAVIHRTAYNTDNEWPPEEFILVK